MKKAVLAGILLVSAVAASATEGNEVSPLATVALKELPQVLRSIEHPELLGLSKESYGISDVLVAGGAATLGEHARQVYSDTRIADEMATSATAPREEPATVTTLPASDLEKMRVVSLTKFELGNGGYHWAALQTQFPSIRAVIRLSEPALDRSGTYGAVRYEVWTQKGLAWAAYQFFELRNDRWRATKLVVGPDV